MLNTTIGAVRKYGNKLGAAAGALVLSSAAMAQSTTADTVVANLEQAFSNGELIAAAVVLGLFAIYAIKLLWRSK
ncbi:hypothetical protein [Comamonas aquatica]|uniref:hypothetical protein n=1 Tax=Comamonas aquatica TaxID=225991 RepID=UPI003918AF67